MALSRRASTALAVSLFSAVAAHSPAAPALAHPPGDSAASVSEPPPSSEEAVRFADDSLRGRSGKLLARFVVPNVPTRALSAFSELFGASTSAQPGVYAVDGRSLSRPFSFIALYPFDVKRGAELDGYRIGFWPGEHRPISGPYANPVGFIEVTPENENLHVSAHFRLRDFLTHDQASVWPKYLVLREDLIDKLELVIAQLEADGHPVRHMTVMSGFRTPQYNATGGNIAGRDEMSRHMYGDASDVFVDNDRNGRMDDLNGDGRIDYRDAQVILAASEKVEREYPDLVGGGGVYSATPAHGPFAHIDVRGDRARWGLLK